MKNNLKLSLLLAIAFSLISSSLWAATKYVRSDGGTPTQCTGAADAAYDGSGTGEACAHSHPFWTFGVDANCAVSAGRNYSAGDTIIINFESFKMGLGAPNTNPGASAFPYDCHILPILSGSDANTKTKIYGENYASCSDISSATELYGAEDSDYIINLLGSSNVDARCIHITDHSECRFRSTLNDGDSCVETFPGQDYAEVGLKSAGSENIELHDFWITGMAGEGASISTPTNWVLGNVNVWGNAGINYNFNGTGAGGTTDQATGTMIFNGGTIAWAGCTLNYPPTYSSYDGITLADPKTCCSQSQGCAADGLGTESNEATWNFANVVFLRNVADGLDLLYHDVDGGTGVVTVNGSKFFKNSGNQLKVGGNSVVTNNAIDADCLAFQGESYTWEYAGDCTTWNGTNQSTCENGHPGCEWDSNGSTCENFSDHCRAAGNAVSLAFQTNTDVYFEGNTIVNTVNAEPFTVTARHIGSCTSGNKLIIKNSVVGTTNGLGWINIDGSCTNIDVTQDHSVIYGFLSNPSGTGNSFTNPGLSGLILGSDQNFLIPSTSSSAYNIADETATHQGSDDMFDFARGAAWDAGAIEFGSSDPGADFDICGDNVKDSGEVCDGSDLNSQTCVSQGFASGTLTCAVNCQSFVTSSCVAGTPKIIKGTSIKGIRI
jgi:hypothetical protein